MRVELSKLDNIIKSMTVSVFASLPSAWPEYMHNGGILIARVDPICDAAGGENDVITRALVFMPEDDFEPSHLRRLTIRYRDTELDYADMVHSPEMQDFYVWRVENYRDCLEKIKTLPVVNLHELFRTWPVTQ